MEVYPRATSEQYLIKWERLESRLIRIDVLEEPADPAADCVEVKLERPLKWRRLDKDARLIRVEPLPCVVSRVDGDSTPIKQQLRSHRSMSPVQWKRAEDSARRRLVRIDTPEIKIEVTLYKKMRVDTTTPVQWIRSPEDHRLERKRSLDGQKDADISGRRLLFPEL